MRLLLLCYCLGIMAATLGQNPARDWLMAGAALPAIGACWLLQTQILRSGRSITGCVFAAVLGVTWHLYWAQGLLGQRLPAPLEGVDMWVSGTVLTLPTRTPTAQQFQFYIEDNAEDFRQRRIMLNAYGESEIQAGQRWRLLVRLNRPHGFANPAGFDYEAWLFQQGITAKGYVRPDPNNHLLGDGEPGINRLRFQLRTRLLAGNAHFENAAMMLALGIGDRSQLGPRDWQLLSDTGTNHLFVVSGLHIGLIAAVGYWFGCVVMRRWTWLALRVPVQKSAAILALLMALGYSLLAGFTLPTQRAFVMTAVFLLGQLSNRLTPVSLRFLIGLVAVLSLNPLAALSAGFWLSFVAVAALLFCLNAYRQPSLPTAQGFTPIKRWLGPQLVVCLALLPFLLFWTQQQSLLAPMVNMVAIPLVGFLVVPLCLLGLVLLLLEPRVAVIPLKICDELLGALIAALTWLADITNDWALLEMHAMTLMQLMFLCLIIVLVLTPITMRMKLLALPLLLPVLWPEKVSIPRHMLAVHVLDVGQGLAVILRTAEHALVYDTGARLSPEFDLGSAVLAPVLHRLGISRLDAVVISHFDSDHVGGLPGLLDTVPASTLYSSDISEARNRLADSSLLVPGLEFRLCQQDLAWHWDGIDFRFLHAQSTGADANDNSCVLQVRVGEQAVLLPGDIEQAAERQLATRYGADLQSEILIAPHHGSNTSSTYAFIKRVAPQFVIYAAGYRNSFGHPTPRTRRRYGELGAQPYTSFSSGMISFTVGDPAAIAPPTLYRLQRPRYWY